MKRSKGQRQGTRSLLKRGRMEKGRLHISQIMHDYEEGDRVAIVLWGALPTGTPDLAPPSDQATAPVPGGGLGVPNF